MGALFVYRDARALNYQDLQYQLTVTMPRRKLVPYHFNESSYPSQKPRTEMFFRAFRFEGWGFRFRGRGFRAGSLEFTLSGVGPGVGIGVGGLGLHVGRPNSTNNREFTKHAPKSGGVCQHTRPENLFPNSTRGCCMSALGYT